MDTIYGTEATITNKIGSKVTLRKQMMPITCAAFEIVNRAVGAVAHVNKIRCRQLTKQCHIKSIGWRDGSNFYLGNIYFIRCLTINV